MSENIVELPVVKVLTGVIVYDCPCGCGRVKLIEIGEPDTRDLLFYAENLRNHTMEEYCEAVEDSESESGEIS